MKKLNRDVMVWVYLLYLLVSAIVVLFSTDKYVSWPILFLQISYFILFITSGIVLFNYKSREIFGIIFILVVAALSAISFYNTFYRGYVNLTSEGLSFIWGYFGHNHLAALLLVAIPLNMYYLWFAGSKLIRVLFAILLMVFIYSLLIAFSRSAILALLLALALGLISFLKSFVRRINYKAIMFGGGVVVLLVLSMWVVWNLKSTRSIYIRTFHFQKGIEMFALKPITGFGLGTFGEVKMPSQYKKQNASFAHNLLIQSLAEGGVILLLGTALLYSTLMIVLLKRVRGVSSVKIKYFSLALAVGVIGMLINEMADFDLQLPAVGGLFWVLVSLICFYEDKSKV